MTIEIVARDGYIEIQTPSQDLILTYEQATELRNKLNDVINWRYNEEVQE